MGQDSETLDLINKLNELEKENIRINNKLKSLEVKNNQITESNNALFNNLFVFHDLKPTNLLENSHEMILQILDFVDNVCKKYDLEWFLFAGSALGALRHGGFIPFDDDCDIGMMRKDYEKFIEIIRKEVKNHHLNNNINVTTAPKINNKVFPFTKIDYHEGDKLLGFVDIFPFDFISSYDENTKKIYMEEHKRLRKELSEGKKRQDILKESFSKLNVSLEKDKYVMSSLEISAFGYAIYDYDDFFPLKKTKFENRYYPVPHNLRRYNEIVYGEDYMKLPPTIRIHDFHYRLFNMENINLILERNILFFKNVNENFDKDINFKASKDTWILCGNGQNIEIINELDDTSSNSYKITRIGDSFTWTDFVIKNIDENDFFSVKFNLINPNSELSVFFVFIDDNKKQKFSKSLRIKNIKKSKEFSLSTPVYKDTEEVHLRFWIDDEIGSVAHINNLVINKTLKLNF